MCNIRAGPTASFQLPHIVTGEPPRPAAQRAFPPAPLLLPAHDDDVTLGEGELVLVGLLEGEACFDQQLATPAPLRHVLRKRGRNTDVKADRWNAAFWAALLSLPR